MDYLFMKAQKAGTDPFHSSGNPVAVIASGANGAPL
jgi:hypothetical protein